MATVTNTVTKPGGDVATLATVIIELVAGVEITSGFVSATNVEILGRNTFSAGVDGTWSKSLTANSDLTPANTMYRVTEQAVGDPDSRTIRYIVVPAGAGTHPVATIEYLPVTAVPTVEPSNEVDAAEITTSTAALAVSSALTLVAAPGLTVTVPDLARPVYLATECSLNPSVTGVVTLSIAPVGSTVITQGVGGTNKSITAATAEGCFARARLPAHSAGDYGVFVSGASGTITVVAAAYSPARITALEV